MREKKWVIINWDLSKCIIYMRFEELFLGFGLVEKVMSRPVASSQSLKSFFQVVMLLKKLDHFPQLPLPTFNWSKPKKECHVNMNDKLPDCRHWEFEFTNLETQTWCSSCGSGSQGKDLGSNWCSDHHIHTAPWQSFLMRGHGAFLPPGAPHHNLLEDSAWIPLRTGLRFCFCS